MPAPTYAPPGGGRSPVPQTAWNPTAQIPNNHPSLYNGTYNIPVPTGNPTYSMVNQAGFGIQQNQSGGWSVDPQPIYPTGWNTGNSRSVPPTASPNPPENSPQEQWRQNMLSRYSPNTARGAAIHRRWGQPGSANNVRLGNLAPQAVTPRSLFGSATSSGPRTLADQARQTVQNTVHNPSQQMYSGLPGLRQMATERDVAANNQIGSQWQDTAKKRNLQNMNVTLSTMPIEQQLGRYGLVAQAGVQHADTMRRMQDLRENWGLSRMNQGLRAAQAIYG